MNWPWKKPEAELEQEIRHHLESIADEYRRRGESPEEAMRLARIDFGGVDKAKEECRDERTLNWMWHLLQDLRFGWRMMRKTPGITLAAMLSLALGIGATTTILALADAVMWRTVNVSAPEQLLEIMWESHRLPEGMLTSSSGSNFRDQGMNVADFFSRRSLQLFRERTKGKAQIAGHVYNPPVSTSFRGEVALTHLRGVSGNFFSVMQVQPLKGRLLGDADDSAGAPPVAVVTHRFWSRHLRADHTAVGDVIRINSIAYVLAGVLPESFTEIVPGDETDIYTAIRHTPQAEDPAGFLHSRMDEPTVWWIQLIGRRSPGTTDHELRSALNAAFAASWTVEPKSAEATPRIRISDASRGLGSIRRQFGNPVSILLALVVVVLIVSCANIANLLLARAVEREKEVALRVSLGCSESRLMRQFFTESMMLAGVGGILSVCVALMLGKMMTTLMPTDFGGLTVWSGLDLRSLAGTAAVTVFTALLFGLYPAWRSTRVDVSPALKEGSGSGATLSRRKWAPARLLVLVQVALGVLLVTSAILFTSHLNDLVSRDAGFERGHVLLADIRPGELGYKDDRLEQFYFNLETRLAALPGVRVAGMSRTRPMRGGGTWDEVHFAGHSRRISAAIHQGNERFMDALGVSLVAGRMFTAREARQHARVAVISEDLASQLGVPSPLGMRLIRGKNEYQVIGIARQARYSRIDQTPPVAYLPVDYQSPSVTLVMRTTVPPLAILSGVRETVRNLDPNLPLVDVYTMDQQISRTLQRERLFAWLCGSFGVLALALCAVGIYGLMSHTTARRTPEIGIRIALGASRTDVTRQVFWDGMRLALAGMILGVPLALYISSLAKAQKLLPEGSLPVPVIASAIALLTTCAAFAVLVPAVRASAVDPLRALRRS